MLVRDEVTSLNFTQVLPNLNPSVSAAATISRAKAEAAKIKVSFAEKEAAMMKEKASIEASLHVLKQEK